MNTIEELAQWVIDNRYTKNSKEKISDFEMFNTIVEKSKELLSKPNIEPCEGDCDWVNLANKTSVCSKCGTTCPF